jgi:hypothetical protein
MYGHSEEQMLIEPSMKIQNQNCTLGYQWLAEMYMSPHCVTICLQKARTRGLDRTLSVA